MRRTWLFVWTVLALVAGLCLFLFFSPPGSGLGRDVGMAAVGLGFALMLALILLPIPDGHAEFARNNLLLWSVGHIAAQILALYVLSALGVGARIAAGVHGLLTLIYVVIAFMSGTMLRAIRGQAVSTREGFVGQARLALDRLRPTVADAEGQRLCAELERELNASPTEASPEAARLEARILACLAGARAGDAARAVKEATELLRRRNRIG